MIWLEMMIIVLNSMILKNDCRSLSNNNNPFPQKIRLMATRAEREQSNATKELQKVLKEMMMRPDNRKCADCRKRGNTE